MPKIEEMTSIPARSNPFHHNHFRRDTNINERFLAMFTDTTSNELIIIDKYTGKRVKMTFPDVRVAKPKPKKRSGIWA